MEVWGDFNPNDLSTYYFLSDSKLCLPECATTAHVGKSKTLPTCIEICEGRNWPLAIAVQE